MEGLGGLSLGHWSQHVVASGLYFSQVSLEYRWGEKMKKGGKGQMLRVLPRP